MAASLSAARGLARFGKRLVDQVSTRDLPPASLYSPLAGFRRSEHSSVYEKNVDEEEVRPGVVPDDIVEQQSEKYWAPNPQTGVFGPANEANPVDSGTRPIPDDSSVLEQKAFFRPLEDLEKPPQP